MRSLRALHAQYQIERDRMGSGAPALSTLTRWSTTYGWQARAEDYDTAIEEEKNRILQAERAAIMSEGIALEHIRVKKLAVVEDILFRQITATAPRKKTIQEKMAEQTAKYEAEEAKKKEAEKRRDVEDEVARAELRDGARPLWLVGDETDADFDAEGEPLEPSEADGDTEDITYPYLWVRDYKGVAGVPYEIERFNSALVAQWRGTQDDAAKETGGRKLRSENTNVVATLTAEDLARAQIDVQDFLKQRFGPLPDVQAGSPPPPIEDSNARDD